MATFAVKFSVKLLPTDMGFVNSSRLKFSPDFQNTEELSRGDLQKKLFSINAVMKYLNFSSSASKLESVTCRFTQIALHHSNFSKNVTIIAEQRYWKIHPDGVFWWQLYFGKFPEGLLLKDGCKDIFIIEILSYTYFAYLTVTSC